MLKPLTVLLLVALATVQGQRGDIDILPPDNLKCAFNRTNLRMMCANATITDVITSMNELIPTQNHPVQPVHISLVNSTQIEQLPDFLNRFNRSLRMVTISHTSLRIVPQGTFSGLGHNLIHLDFSWNQLESLPRALKGLTALEYLDLSHNKIVEFRGDLVFRAPLNLLTLDLSFNSIGSPPIGVRTEPDVLHFETNPLYDIFGKRRRRRDIAYTGSYTGSQKHLSLGDAVETLHYLDLSNNSLTKFPEMLLHRQLPYLKVLKLTNNSVPEYPVTLKRKLPRLQKLYLQGNKISWIPSYSLQRGLAFLDYLDNPAHCACDSLRLREFIENNNMEANLPRCVKPNQVRGFSFRDLPQSLCEVTSTTSTTTTTTTTEPPPTTTIDNRSKYMRPIIVKTNITAGYDQIRLIWTVNYKRALPSDRAIKAGNRIKWYAVYRTFGTANKTILKISSDVPLTPGNQSYEYTISDLDPASSYIVCFQSNRRDINAKTYFTTMDPSNICQEVLMTGEKTFPVVEVAVATTVSTSTTMAIVAFFCFCCPKSLCKRRKKRKTKSRGTSSTDKPTKQQSSQKLCDASETEIETSKFSLDRRSGIQYIDHANLICTQSSPDLTSTMGQDNKIIEPYLEPIKSINNTLRPLDAAFRGIRMDSYVGCKEVPAPLHARRQFRRRNTVETDIGSDSDESENSVSILKKRQTAADRCSNWHDGKLLNYIRPLSADNVSPTTSQSGDEDMKPKLGRFFFPRAYTTYK